MFRPLLAAPLLLFLLLSKTALWLFSNCLCTLSYISRPIHHCCNVCPPPLLSLPLSLICLRFNICLCPFLCLSVGSIVLYTGQGKFHNTTSDTLDFVVKQANTTVDNLRNVSYYLAAAKKIEVDQVFLPPNVQNSIDNVDTKISAAASTLETETKNNSNDIKDALETV